MKKKLNKKIVQMIQIPIIVVILFFALRELYNIFVDIDVNLFNMYSDKLTVTNIMIIIVLGIISYLPLAFYDLIIKKKVQINLSTRKVYKYSWIASSISNLVGFGGSSAIFLKNHFYKKYVDDSSKLIKETSKVVGLNLSGFSLVCLIYSLWSLVNGRSFDYVFFISALIGLYIPIIFIGATYKVFKNRNKENYYITLKIMFTSILEWATTILLIYGLIVILGIKVTLSQFFPIYVMAIIVAMISMVPSGVGTFDLTLLVGLKEFNVPSEQVLLLIILYRLSYYIIPVLIGLVLYLSDLYMKINEEAREVISRLNSKLAHCVLKIMLFITGISLIFGNNIHLKRYFPHKNEILNMDIVELSISLSIIIGFILIVLSTILHTKTKEVYYFMVFVFAVITIGGFFSKYNIHECIFIGLVWILILFSRKMFYRIGFIYTWKNAIKDIAIILLTLSVYLISSYSKMVHYIHRKIPILNLEEIVKSFYKDNLVSSVFIGATIALLLVMLLILLNRLNKFPKEELDKEKVKKIIENYGGSRLIHYVFLGDKYIYINKNEDVLFQYQISGDKIIVLGNPVGNKENFFNGIQEFLEFADLYGYTLVFSGVDVEVMGELHDLGYEFMKLGQDAWVELDKFSLVGNKNKSNRQAIGRITKAGYEFSIVSPPYNDELFNEIKEVSEEWLNGQKEKGFCVGFLDRDYIEMDKVAIVRNSEGELKGFATIMPMYDGETLSVDLMRFKKIELNGIMDYMFANIFEYAKENGFKYFNLGLAPLADVGRTKHAFLREKIAYQIFVYGNFVYSFKGLKKFKEKYATRWEDRYIAYKKGSSVIITVIQLMLVLTKEKDNFCK